MEHLLNQTVILKPKQGQSGYGTPIYSDGYPVAVRWEDSIQIIKNKEGEEVVSNAKIFTLTPMKIDDILVYNEIEWPIIKVASIPGMDGSIHHWEVYV